LRSKRIITRFLFLSPQSFNFFRCLRHFCIMKLLSPITSIAIFVLYSSLTYTSGSSNFQGIDGRWSFSLTTFDTTGKLKQAEYALRASSLGPAVVATTTRFADGGKNRVVLFVSRHSPSNALINDDGTSRFVQIHRQIVVAHTGIGADGRKVIAEAQRAAVEYSYTFDEDIPLERFLDEMSMIFQQYTMKPGFRPCGCSMLIAYIPSSVSTEEESNDEYHQMDDSRPQFYRIDPSGSIHYIADDLVTMGSVTEGVKDIFTDANKNKNIITMEDAVDTISEALISAANKKDKVPKWNQKNCRFLVATFSLSHGLEVAIR